MQKAKKLTNKVQLVLLLALFPATCVLLEMIFFVILLPIFQKAPFVNQVTSVPEGTYQPLPTPNTSPEPLVLPISEKQPFFIDQGTFTAKFGSQSQVRPNPRVSGGYLLSVNYGDNPQHIFFFNNTPVVNLESGWHQQLLSQDPLWKELSDWPSPQIQPLTSRFLGILGYNYGLSENGPADQQLVQIALFDTLHHQFIFLHNSDETIDSQHIYGNLVTHPNQNSFSYFYLPEKLAQTENNKPAPSYVIERDVSLVDFSYKEYQVPFSFGNLFELQKNAAVNQFYVSSQPDAMYLIARIVGQTADDPGYAIRISQHQTSLPFRIPNSLNSDFSPGIWPYSFQTNPIPNSTSTLGIAHQVQINDGNGQLFSTLTVPGAHFLQIIDQLPTSLYLTMRYDCFYGNGCTDGVSSNFGFLDLKTKVYFFALNNPLTAMQSPVNNYPVYDMKYLPVVVGVEP